MLVVAVAGPWWFDRIHVPAQYPCSFRLEDDSCGIPAPGAYMFSAALGELLRRSGEVLSGAIGLGEWALIFPGVLIVSLLLLPFFSTLLLILAGDGRRRQRFTVVAWVLGATVALIFGLTYYARLLWALWGLWAYIGLSAGALTLEALTLAAERRSSPEQREGRLRR